MSRNDFINEIATYIIKEGAERGYSVYSPMIAQAICESRYGESILGTKFHNYFGMKCGKGWKGESVNLKTKEEYQPGTLTSIVGNFRVYSSMREGVKGYFDFINTKRYQNLKQCVTPRQFCETIKADGYATSSSYVNTLMSIIEKNNLTRFDFDNVSVSNSQPTNERTVQVNPRRNEEIAVEVIRGKWGNGRERRSRLEAAGYNYTQIQSIVNKMLRGR